MSYRMLMSTIKLKKLVAEIYQEVINQMTLGITINYKELTEACIIIESSKDLTIKQS